VAGEKESLGSNLGAFLFSAGPANCRNPARVAALGRCFTEERRAENTAMRNLPADLLAYGHDGIRPG
jgi:hypothetical protein